ncbi:hypothetical protein AVEN_156526-1, partial [Araneus ventricosus]
TEGGVLTPPTGGIGVDTTQPHIITIPTREVRTHLLICRLLIDILIVLPSSDTDVRVLMAMAQPFLKEVRIVTVRGKTPAIMVSMTRSKNLLTNLVASHPHTLGASRFDKIA